MQVFLVKSNLKHGFFKNILKKIEIKGDMINLNYDLKKMNLNKKIKIVKKISTILKYNNSKKVILAKELKKDKQFMNLLNSNNIDVITGRILFKSVINQIIDNEISQNRIKKEESEIAITVNEKGKWESDFIKKISKEYKVVKVVTNNFDDFKKVEEELYEKYGIIITTTNNKRKALRDSKIILNIDFPEELLNKYLIYDNSILINLQEPIKIKKKRFCGKIINDYKISLKESTKIYKDLMQDKYKDYYLEDLAECYTINNPKELQNINVY